jgi:hypothetical protein
MLSGGQIRENGFPYRENQRSLEILRSYVSSPAVLEIITEVEYVEKVMFANNKEYLRFLKQQSVALLREGARDQFTDNAQI